MDWEACLIWALMGPCVDKPLISVQSVVDQYLQLWLLTFLLLIKDILIRSSLGTDVSVTLRLYTLHITSEPSGKCELFHLGSFGPHWWTLTKTPLMSSEGRQIPCCKDEGYYTLNSRVLPRCDYRLASTWALEAIWGIWNNSCLRSWPWGNSTYKWPVKPFGPQSSSTGVSCFPLMEGWHGSDACPLPSESKGHFLQCILQGYAKML